MCAWHSGWRDRALYPLAGGRLAARILAVGWAAAAFLFGLIDTALAPAGRPSYREWKVSRQRLSVDRGKFPKRLVTRFSQADGIAALRDARTVLANSHINPFTLVDATD